MVEEYHLFYYSYLLKAYCQIDVVKMVRNGFVLCSYGMQIIVISKTSVKNFVMDSQFSFFPFKVCVVTHKN